MTTVDEATEDFFQPNGSLYANCKTLEDEYRVKKCIKRHLTASREAAKTAAKENNTNDMFSADEDTVVEQSNESFFKWEDLTKSTTITHSVLAELVDDQEIIDKVLKCIDTIAERIYLSYYVEEFEYNKRMQITRWNLAFLETD